MKNYKKMSYPKIWVSNSCGQLFFFELVPKDEDGGIEEWWENNDIDDVVGNNHNSCEWGEYESTKNIKTPEGGWVTEETDDVCKNCEEPDDDEEEEAEEEEISITMSKPKTEAEFIKEWKDWDSKRLFKFNYTDEQYKKYYKSYLEKFSEVEQKEEDNDK